MNGKIDNVAIWSKDFSEQEMQEQFSAKLTGTEPGLLCYWNFNEGDGNIINDLSGNGNNGVINGASRFEGGSESETPLSVVDTVLSSNNSIVMNNLTNFIDYTYSICNRYGGKSE